MTEAQLTLTAEDQLREDIGSFACDPLGYAAYAFDWNGDPELRVMHRDVITGPNRAIWNKRFPHLDYGPDEWQCEYLIWLGEEITNRGFNPDQPVTVDPIESATTSGHGIGKSALVGILACFLLDTRPGCKGIITANTGEQLRSKTFSQIAVWRRRSITRHWWDVSTGDMYVRNKTDHEWRADAVTWKRELSEAFAGQHQVASTSFYIFDEGSAVADEIYEVSEGGLTDGEPMRFLFGNPTRNNGFFYEAFHKLAHRFKRWQIDSRTCFLPNKRQIAQLIDDYGEDSDFSRVRIKGLFPRAGSNQFIAHDVVRAAQIMEPAYKRTDPMVMTIDVARFGSDETVFAFRRGNDAERIPWQFFRGLDTMEVAARAAEAMDIMGNGKIPVQKCFIDGGGVGGGVVDRLRSLGYPVVEVNFGGRPDDPTRYLNKSAEMWGRCREWLKDGGSIPDDAQLADQLTGREYQFTPKNQIAMERKEHMAERGLESPDRADALVLSFATRLAPRDPRRDPRSSNVAEHEWNPLEDA